MGRRKFWEKNKKQKKPARKTVAELTQEVEEVTEVFANQVNLLKDRHNRNLKNLLESTEQLNEKAENFEETSRKVKEKKKLEAICFGAFTCCPKVYYILSCGCSRKRRKTKVVQRKSNLNVEVKAVQEENDLEAVETTSLTEVDASHKASTLTQAKNIAITGDIKEKTQIESKKLNDVPGASSTSFVTEEKCKDEDYQKKVQELCDLDRQTKRKKNRIRAL